MAGPSCLSARGAVWACVLAGCGLSAGAARTVALAGGGAPDSDASSARVQRELPLAEVRAALARLPPELRGSVLDAASCRYQIASCNGSSIATLWGPTGPRRLLRGHVGVVTGMFFFRLGDRILTWSTDGAAIVWDAASGALLLELRWGDGCAVRSAGVFAEGERVVTCGGDAPGSCVVWDAVSGARLWVLVTPSPAVDEGASCAPRSVEVFPGEDRLLTWGKEDAAIIWDVASGRILCTLRGAGGDVTMAAVAAGGRRVATGGPADRRLAVWDAASCRLALELTHAYNLRDMVTVSGGDKVAALDRSGLVAVWSAESGARLHTLSNGISLLFFLFVYGLKAFEDSELLVTYGPGTMTVWNTSSGSAWRRISSPHISGIAVAPGGDMVATCSVHGRIDAWDVDAGRELHSLDDKGPSGERAGRCAVAVGLGPALDVRGFGRGLPVREISRFARRAVDMST